jgi:AraC-like DNA-binding protein
MTDLRISEILDTLNISEQSHFYRKIRKRYGCSLTELRQKTENGQEKPEA